MTIGDLGVAAFVTAMFIMMAVGCHHTRGEDLHNHSKKPKETAMIDAPLNFHWVWPS